jgi:hypothetical protein
MTETGFSPKTGQALLFVIFLLALAGILAPAVAAIWGNEMRLRSLEARGLSAFYLAQAGIERAKIMVLSGYWTAGDYNITNQNDLDVAGDNYQFLYDMKITNSGAAARTLKGTGRVLDLAGNNLAHREIQMVVDGISDTSPVDGFDDDMTGSAVTWSWQER